MSGPLLGQALALFSAVCFAATSVFVARTTVRSGDRGVTFSVVVTIVFSTALWLATEGPDLTPLAREGALAAVGWFALAGLCAMVFGRSLLYASIRTLGVTRASATKRLNPFFSVAVAALVLAEPVTALAGAGMAVIAAAFWMLVRASLRRAATGGPAPGLLDYATGAGAAFAYALAYVTRKLGLEILPSPALGTLISAVAGLAVFAAMTPFDARQRANFAGMVGNLDRWTFLAAILMSLGQISLFAALLHEDVTVIVMIASLEVFIAAFLSVAVFRTEERPDAATLVAATLATAGVVMVALG